MTLSDLLRSMKLGAGTAETTIGDDWLQGRSVFGGLQAAIAVAAMRTLVPLATPLRTLQMTFVAPVEQGRVYARAGVLRAGKNATQVEARLESAGTLQAQIVGVFGTTRDSIVRHVLSPPAPLSSERQRLAFKPGAMPNFLQHFDVDLLEGAPPFTNAHVLRNVYEIGLRDDGPMSEAHLLVLADFVPPVALSWMSAATPGSSLTWMLEVLTEDFAAQPLHRWRVEAEMVAAGGGYTSQSTLLRAPDGSAVALSRQCMVVFG